MAAMNTDLLTHPPRLPLVLPSILSADFARLGDEVAGVLDAGADAIHVDVMDGHFVPNLTMGPAICLSLRKRFPHAYLDVHLMVEDPGKFVRPFADAGANCLTFHAEVMGDEPAARGLVETIRGAGCGVGVAINPPTPADAVDPVRDLVDMVLVMSVHPGFSGQKFMADVLDKTRAIKLALREDQRLEMDGGINADTAEQVRAAGCDTIVAASYLFSAPDRAEAIRLLRGA